MNHIAMKKRGPFRLRSYITLAITGTVTFILVFCSIFFYYKTARLLADRQREQIMQQLGRVNEKVEEQIKLIDSLNVQFMSNTLIREQVEPSTYSPQQKLAVEKQMGYLLINNYLWQNGLIHSACIFLSSDRAYHLSEFDNAGGFLHLKEAFLSTSRRDGHLNILTIEAEPRSLYFSRNLYSSNTGRYIATTVFEIDRDAWSNYFNSNMDSRWTIYLYGDGMNMMTKPQLESHAEDFTAQSASCGESQLKELQAGEQEYLFASRKVPNTGITSMVIAPKNQMVDDLNRTLRVYWLVLFACVGAAILLSLSISGAILSPIRKMIDHMDKIAGGHRETPMPEAPMYSEFHALTDAFNHMLEQVNAYYKDNMEKQLLLKNSEIRSLQAQMDPHFLFNTLNTIAWKAQMTGDEEIYQMVISLGELLKTNVVAKELSFTTLGEELEYVRLYTYLQKMRFEDKISVNIQVSPDLFDCVIPRLCIQPLVENAFVHGLEPKKGSGKLAVNVILQEEQLEIDVLDNGIGFGSIPDIHSIRASAKDDHTHIGLRNLDRRLCLLYGEAAGLTISSVPYVCTTVSFHVPLKAKMEEEKHHELSSDDRGR